MGSDNKTICKRDYSTNIIGMLIRAIFAHACNVGEGRLVKGKVGPRGGW
jgi:hypothetical protein